MPDDRSAQVAAAHAAADRALAKSERGEPVRQEDVDFLKTLSDRLDMGAGTLDSLKKKISSLESKVEKKAEPKAEPAAKEEKAPEAKGKKSAAP